MECGESFECTVEADSNFVIEDDVGANVILYSSQSPSNPTSTPVKVPNTGKVLTLTKVSAPNLLRLSKVSALKLPPGKELTPVKILASGKAMASGKVLRIGEALSTADVLTSGKVLTSAGLMTGKLLTTGKVLTPVKVLNPNNVVVKTSKQDNIVEVVKEEPPDQIFYETVSVVTEDEDVAVKAENVAMGDENVYMEELEDENVSTEDEIVTSEEDVKAKVVCELQDAPEEDAVQYELVFDNNVGRMVQVPSEHDYAPLAQSEFFCGVCGKSFPAERGVRMHMALVHFPKQEAGKKKLKASAAKSIVCDQCGKKYKSNVHLRYHQRVHTGEKPYQCTMCSKAFTMPYYLQIHTRTHTGERPYSCLDCPKAFNNPAALGRHKRVHTGEKPYSCDTCGKSFTQSNSLKLHIRTVHLKQPAPYKSKERRLGQLLKKQMEAQGDTSIRTQAKPKTRPQRMYEIMNVIENDGESLEENFVLTY